MVHYTLWLQSLSISFLNPTAGLAFSCEAFLQNMAHNSVDEFICKLFNRKEVFTPCDLQVQTVLHALLRTCLN